MHRGPKSGRTDAAGAERRLVLRSEAESHGKLQLACRIGGVSAAKEWGRKVADVVVEVDAVEKVEGINRDFDLPSALALRKPEDS